MPRFMEASLHDWRRLRLAICRTKILFMEVAYVPPHIPISYLMCDSIKANMLPWLQIGQRYASFDGQQEEESPTFPLPRPVSPPSSPTANGSPSPPPPVVNGNALPSTTTTTTITTTITEADNPPSTTVSTVAVETNNNKQQVEQLYDIPPGESFT
ncbi:hypothetical protein J6590_081336 [Homalodisca vitripennis]|nr:hypothetical protein J6590_081336 [Homalodisca vitripennis]